MSIAHDETHKIPDKKIILSTMLVVGLAIGGGLGWASLKQQQAEKIQQAQNQLTTACQAGLNSQIETSEVFKKVDSSIQLLQSVPQIPGLGYQVAQDQLASFSTCIQKVKVKNNFFTAQQLSQAALAVNSSTILSASEWQTLKSSLEQSIALLHGIPKDVDSYDKAQQDLQIYQPKLEEIDRRLTYEIEADQTFAGAEKLSQAANTLLAGSPDNATLLKAVTQLEQAIQLLKTIPAGHRVSAKSQASLGAYQQQLANIHYQVALSQLKTFVDDFYNFTATLDTTLTYHAYSETLNSLNDRFYTITKNAPAILNHAAAQASQKALNHCNDAMIVWRYCHEGNCYSSLKANIPDLRGNLLWIPGNFQIGDSSLQQAYPVPLTKNIWMQSYVQQNLALSTIWDAAKQNVSAARDAIN